MEEERVFTVPTVTVNEDFVSVFSESNYSTSVRGGMLLTDRIDAQNLRLRESSPGYFADFHVAGDPTLITIQQGILQISLRDGSSKNFGPGESFIASDFLPDGLEFDSTKHGHSAAVLGDQVLRAIHVKLATRPN
ncbi:unnamed protein product [Heterosigma akashiwo]